MPGAQGRLGSLNARITTTAGLLLVVALPPAPLWSLYRDPAQRSADVRGAVLQAHARYQPSDTILHTSYQTYLPALWYDHQQPARGDGPHPAPCKIGRAHV